MSLSFLSSFSTQVNLVLPLAQNNSGLSIRVASQGSGTLGTLTVAGLQSTSTWSLSAAAPAWITSTIDSTGTICTLTFSGAQYQQNPYEFFVSCTDGINPAVNFPIYLEIRDPFYIAANPSNPVVNGTTLNIPSYDAAVADIEIQGYGLFGSVQGNCNFILPSSLPTGLNYVTSNESSLLLRVSEAHFGDTPFTATDLVGGLQIYSTSPVAVPFTIQAYQPGSFYDEPDRAFPLTLSISSQTQQAGVLNFGAGAYFNTTMQLLAVDAQIDTLLGTLQAQGAPVAQPLSYHWSSSGPLTPNSGGGTTTNKSATYSTTATGAATVNIQVYDGNGLPVQNGLKSINFSAVALGTTNWMTATTAAFKVGVSSDILLGYFGETLTLTLSSPDGFINGSSGSETIFFTLNTVAQSSIESALPNPIVNTTSAFIDSSVPNATVSFQFPAGAAIGNKWVLTIAAANGTSGPTRSGYAQVLFECTGNPPMTITGVSSTINSSTGSSITPLQLAAFDPSDSPVSSAQFALVGGTDFGSSILGAPDGLSINSLNQIVGNATTPGTYNFVVAATASGFLRSYSQVVTMTVSQVLIPLQITNPISSASSIPDNTTFTLSWGISGNATALYLAETPATTPVRTVTGSGSATVQQVGSTVYSIYGTSYYGTAYSVPLMVLSSSIASATNLLPSPTIALIDEDYNLTANWQPYSVNGAYTAYLGWNISLQTPPGTGTIVTVFDEGLSNGGTASARVFEETLAAGDYSMNMTALSANYTIALNSNPWDASHTFPPSLQAANVTLSNTNLLLGQTLTITLNANYANANSWQIIFPDNTSTGWLPLSTRTIAKSFTISGALDIIIQTQNSFSTANPPVNLRRQLTQQVYVIDQQYNPAAAAEGALTGTLGIGGEAGFEIVDASTGAGAVTPQPYAVVVRSVARDTVTNELKLMVATSRFPNASSLLSTMAIDVFPFAGRPHAKELITPIYILETNALTSSIPVSITTTTLPSNSYVGKPMQEFAMQATGGNLNYSWYSEGLPPGLKMNVDGTISGTPTELGVFTVVFAVMDGSQPAYIAETTLTFTIPTDLVITTTSLPNAVVGTSYENYTNPSNPQPITITNTGGLAPYTWAIVAGSIPIGLSIAPSTGILGGVPCTYNSTTDFTKSFTFTVQVTDAIGAKASANYTISLSPAALSFGLLNQPTIIADEQFKLAVPVFGGQSPYTLNSFSDNGIIGTGLAIVSPLQMSAEAGLTPASLTILTANTIFYPASYPNNVALLLTATGGVPSNASADGFDTDYKYKFYVDPTVNNTLLGAVCYGPLLVGTPTTDGTWTVGIKCVDSVGNIASKVLNITTQAQGSGEYTLAAYTVNTNGFPTTPTSWTLTPLLNGFPDPVSNVNYTPGSNSFYCVVLLNNGTVQLSNGANPPVTQTIINGSLPAGMTYTSANSFYGTTGADCVILLQGTPTANGGASFEFQLTGIINASNASVSTAQRFSLNVGGGGTGTPVVAITFSGALDLDLNTLVTDAIGSFSWAYPLLAEGGTAPYSFAIQSGTTLPGISTGVSIGNFPAFSSGTSTLGVYSVSVVAADTNGYVSVATTIPVIIAQSTSQPIHILSNNIPASVYVNTPIPANTYYVESDIIANWTATGLPVGITLSPAPGTRVYLQGTPTQVTASSTITFTATSAVYGTQATTTAALAVAGQSASIISPSHTGATAVIGTQYRVINNNSIVSVAYVGFQPGQTGLPLLVNTLESATLGSPTLTIGGQPTTGNINVTANGFTMLYDYLPTGPGTDTLTFGSQSVQFPDSITISEVWPTLIVAGNNVSQSVSEYIVTQNLQLAGSLVTITGGDPPYSINVTGVSDSRFVVQQNTTSTAYLQITVAQFAAGGTYSCSVSMTVTDNAGNTSSATGTLNVTVIAQTTTVVTFEDYTWNISLSSPAEPQVGTLIPNQFMSLPQLGHPPYSYYVDSVSVPSGLGSFIQVSPTKRVLAFNLNETNTTVSVADANANLGASGSYNVTATNLASAPAAGTYTMSIGLWVIDNNGDPPAVNGTVLTRPVIQTLTVNITS